MHVKMNKHEYSLIKKRHGFMINACHVKLKIEIELYRTTKHENA